MDSKTYDHEESELVYYSKSFLTRMGGLKFLLRCNYDTKYLEHLPTFYKNILEFFQRIKNVMTKHKI